jgi:hypothetical protein
VVTRALRVLLGLSVVGISGVQLATRAPMMNPAGAQPEMAESIAMTVLGVAGMGTGVLIIAGWRLGPLSRLLASTLILAVIATLTGALHPELLITNLLGVDLTATVLYALIGLSVLVAVSIFAVGLDAISVGTTSLRRRAPIRRQGTEPGVGDPSRGLGITSGCIRHHATRRS